jgi:hypothetical protein
MIQRNPALLVLPVLNYIIVTGVHTTNEFPNFSPG